MSSLTIVIPTHDDSEELPPLLASLDSQPGTGREVILVDDGSGPADRERLRILAGEKLRVLALDPRRGRFGARLEGAKAASSELLVFADARTELPPGLLARLESALATEAAVMPWVRIREGESVFSLYWERSHRWFFRGHFANESEPQFLTKENFERRLKGTTCFAVRKDVFLAAAADFAGASPQNDDTPLLYAIACRARIALLPDVFVFWRPRQRLLPFLARLWSRGPGFVEYYFRRPGSFLWKWLWLAFLLGNLAILAAPFAPVAALAAVAAFALLVAVQAARMSRGPLEFARIYPVHFLSVAGFGVSVYLATWKELFRRDHVA